MIRGLLLVLLLSGCDAQPDDVAAEPDATTSDADAASSCIPGDEVCNGVDDDCDGRTDEDARNACGECGAEPVEVCDGVDNDCDGALDEGTQNACGECGAAPDERCNGADDDCDGETDEGVTNACGACGEVPVEVCDERDNDCDGEVDEGTTNACGGCGIVPAEACNELDDDCDGVTDEGVLGACGDCAEIPDEVCNGVDDDCDGDADEGVANACGGCGEPPPESCNGRDDDCDGWTDEDVLNACSRCGPVPREVCNGEDDDCDGATDEGVLNACGLCGVPPAEVCNGVDDDCDGAIDELVTNACGECGPLPVERCDERDNDCDEAIDEGLAQNRCGTGCGPEPPDVCNRFDDDCDGTADEGLPANACGFCGALPQEVCDEADNDCDGAVDEGFARNACGDCGPAPQEVCNALDEDCDGRVDEGFDVGRSIDHCARCDAACSRDHATPACIGGRCVLLACDDGWRDADLDAATGCEAETPLAGTLHVDDDADPDVADGTLDLPFATIGAALEAAQPNALVLVLPGVYEADVLLETDGVTLRSREPRAATIRASGELDVAPLVTLTGSHASLVDFTVEARGRPVGLRMECAVGCTAAGNDVRADWAGAIGGAEVPTVGIDVVAGESVTVRDNVVHDLVAGRLINHGAPKGFDAIGIRVVGGRGVVVAANSVERALAGTPAAPSNPDLNVCGGRGGQAYGVRLVGCVGARVSGTLVSDLTGGNGGPSTSGTRIPGPGGTAYGMSATDCSDLAIDGAGVDGAGERLAITGLVGGVADHRTGINASGWAVGLQLTDVVDADVVDVLVRRPTGGAGVRRDSPGPPASGGGAAGVRLTRVQDVRFERNTVQEPTGGRGDRAAPRGATYGFQVDSVSTGLSIGPTNTVDEAPVFLYDGFDDIAAVGLRMLSDVRTTNLGRIVVRRGRNVRVEDCEVVGPTGVQGATPIHSVHPTKLGGNAFAIRLEDIRGATSVLSNTIRDVRGGAAGLKNEEVAGARGGSAHGIHTARCDLVELHGNIVEGIVAGEGSPDATQGSAAAVALEEGALSAFNNLVVQVEGDDAAGFRLGPGLELAEVARSTVVAVEGDERGNGVFIGRDIGRGARVVDSIFFRTSHAAVAQDEENEPDAALVDYSLFDRAGAPENITVGDNNLREDVGFTNEFAGDYSLGPNSPCIDAGDPGGACGDEPVSEGGACRPDMGHLAGTAGARAR